MPNMQCDTQILNIYSDKKFVVDGQIFFQLPNITNIA